MSDDLNKIKERKKQWEEGPLKKALKRYPFLQEPPTKFYSPIDRENKKNDFLEKIGFPGEYPFTSGTYPTEPMAGLIKMSAMPGADQAMAGGGNTRASLYSGYGTSEDTRDYYKNQIAEGVRQGPNLAMDLPTQCGYDSDNPMVEGEVGKVGVSIDTLRDYEIVYEPYQGDINLDQIASNFTINAPAGFFMGMYVALAQNRGIPVEKLKATPQNDILKEFVARGTYIFPPRPSIRLFRDTLVFITKNMPRTNITSLGGYHMREAGATREQDLAFSMANVIEYFQAGVDAGVDIDAFAPRISFNAFGGSMEMLKEVAFHRAARRMYARIVKERFGAKNPKSMIIKVPVSAHIGCSRTTLQRPLNNLTRAVVGAVAGALSGGMPAAFPPYDEPLGLGWSLEAQQLMRDATKIIMCEAKLLDVTDPFAGSYCMEQLTDEIEEAAQKELNKIEEMGGMVRAIEEGYIQKCIGQSAHEMQKRIENGEELLVGVNCFTGENELEVATERLVDHPYDSSKREEAEEKQKKQLTQLKKSRDNRNVGKVLKDLENAAKDESINLMPFFIDCAKAYASEQEVCDVLRDIFGEYKPTN